MPSPLDLPNFKKGDPARAADINKITAAVRRQTLQPGQFQSGAFLLTRALGRGGDRGGLNLGSVIVDLQLAHIVAEVPAASYSATYSGEDITALSRTAGEADAAAIPFVLDSDELTAELWPDDHPTKAGDVKLLKARNHYWDYPIFAGNGRSHGDGFANDEQIWALGWVGLLEGADPEDEPAFNIIFANIPFTLIEGLTTAAVAGGVFNIDGATVLSGLKYKGSKIDGVENPGAWDSDDNARAVVGRSVVDNDWYALDLDCPS